MLAIYLKEIRSFLGSLIAYIVMSVFLTGVGLFMWVFDEYNVLDAGYANMNTLFNMGPYIFIFLISAVTMRSFAEEKKTGTIELLTTSPISDLRIILAKYFAAVTLVLFTLIPTLIYYYTVSHLSSPAGNMDHGAIQGSYMGLFLLASGFCAIGIFSSVVTDNQIVAFILSLFLCFFFYSLLFELGSYNILGGLDTLARRLSILEHYESMSRGVIDTRDVLYFLSLITAFLWASKTVFGSRKW